MTRYLLDVNILLGLFWEDHQFHKLVLHWFNEHGQHSFATCGLTQSGFVRLSSNPQYSKRSVSVNDALHLLSVLTEKAGHVFWPLEIGIRETTEPLVSNLFGHKQVTEAYLLGLAIRQDGTLVTLDRAIPQLAGKAFAQHVLLLK